MGKPLVSIVTPTLNQAGFIRASLDSVATQTYTEIEHVVIDGGSTDGTVAILRDYLDTRFAWISGPDAGMYDAVNNGLARTSGEIVAYLNSDDAYLPWAVERVVAQFEADPATDLLFGDGVRIDAATGEQRLRLFSHFNTTGLAHYGSLMQPSVFLRRRAVERVGAFDASLRFVADLDMWLRIAAGGTVRHLDEVLSVERDHSGALSVAQATAMATEEALIRHRHGADLGSPAGQARLRAARRHEKVSARARWMRFLAAGVRPSRGRPWGRFLTEGEVEVDRVRLLTGLLPRVGYARLPGSVRSRLAHDVLGLPF